MRDRAFITNCLRTSTKKDKKQKRIKITMKAYTLLAVIFVTIYASSAFDVSAGMGKHKGIASNTRVTKLLKVDSI